jgi:chitodextrinase
MRHFTTTLTLVLVLLCQFATAQKPYETKKKKIIEFGRNIPNYDFVADNLAAMEYAPFDGVVFDLRIPKLGGTVRRSWSVCNPDEVKESDFDFTKLSKIKSAKFTDNFIRVFVQDDYDQNKFSWFDEAVWTNIKKTAQLLSKAVKISNSKGVFIDTEEYYGPKNPWLYNTTLYPNQTAQQVYDKVRQRGREYMSEIQSDVPNIKIMYSFAYDFVEQWGTATYYDQSYALLKPFLDGMLEAAGPQVTLIDGNEATYFTDKNEDYTWWYDQVNVQYLKDRIPSELISKYKKQYRAAYTPIINRYYNAFYDQPGYDFNWGLAPANLQKLLEHAIYNRLLMTDEYVWTWSQGDVKWWENKNFLGKQEWIDATIAAKEKLNNGKAIGYTVSSANNKLKADISTSVITSTLTYPAHNSNIAAGEVTFKVQFNDATKNSYHYFYVNGISKGYSLNDTEKVTLTDGIYTAFVFGYDKDNKSYQSNPVTFTVGNPTQADTQAPTVPTNLVANNITQTSFGLSWTASTDNVSVANYEVFANNISVGKTATTNFNITNRVANTIYAVSVKAIDGTGNTSLASSVLSVKTLAVPADIQAPTVPTFLSANNITQTSFGIAWTASTDNVGVASYEVFVNNISIGKTATTNFNVTNRVAATTYAIIVKAIDAAGNVSASSNTLSVKTLAIPPSDTQAPSIPTNLAANNVTQTGFGLTWTTSTDNVGVTGYEVFINNVSVGKTATTNFIVTNRIAATTYLAAIKAFDAAGNISALSTNIYVKTLANTVVTPPSTSKIIDFVDQPAGNIAMNPAKYSDVDGKGSEAYFINFNTFDGVIADQKYNDNSPLGNNRMGLVSNNYAILYFTKAVKIPSFYVNAASTSVSATWKIEGTLNGTTQFSYDSKNALPFGKWVQITLGKDKQIDKIVITNGKDICFDDISIESTSATPIPNVDTQAPTAPINVVAYSISQKSGYLYWSPSSDNVGVKEYEIYLNNVAIGKSNSTYFTLNNLTPSTTYTITIKAIDAAGNISQASNTLTIKTLGIPDYEKPTTPYNLTASNITSTSFTLSWATSTDNIGVSKYLVYKNYQLEAVVNGNITTLDLKTLTASTVYSMFVVAVDAAGNPSNYSVALPVKTLSTTGTARIDGSKNLISSLKVGPNPVNDVLNISFISESNIPTQYQIVDFNGKTFLSQTIQSELGFNQLQLNTSDVPNGLYVLTIKRNDQIEQLKIVVQGR